MRTALDDRQRRLAEGLRGAGLILLGLINDILDLSKIESGRLELEATEFEVRTVLDETATVVMGPADEKGIELVVDCDARRAAACCAATRSDSGRSSPTWPPTR